MSTEYTCEICKGTFIEGWSEEEAQAEMLQNFGPIPDHDRAVICDECYKELFGPTKNIMHAMAAHIDAFLANLPGPPPS